MSINYFNVYICTGHQNVPFNILCFHKYQLALYLPNVYIKFHYSIIHTYWHSDKTVLNFYILSCVQIVQFKLYCQQPEYKSVHHQMQPPASTQPEQTKQNADLLKLNLHVDRMSSSVLFKRIPRFFYLIQWHFLQGQGNIRSWVRHLSHVGDIYLIFFIKGQRQMQRYMFTRAWWSCCCFMRDLMCSLCFLSLVQCCLYTGSK